MLIKANNALEGVKAMNIYSGGEYGYGVDFTAIETKAKISKRIITLSIPGIKKCLILWILPNLILVCWIDVILTI